MTYHKPNLEARARAIALLEQSASGMLPFNVFYHDAEIAKHYRQDNSIYSMLHKLHAERKIDIFWGKVKGKQMLHAKLIA